MKTQKIDRAALRTRARKLKKAELWGWIERAIQKLPDEALIEMVSGDFPLEEVTVRARKEHTETLEEALEFYSDSLRGHYYQSFRVNSRNYMDKSEMTEAFIDRAVGFAEAAIVIEKAGDYEVAGEIFEMIIDLMEKIDENDEEIIFMADEHGSWQVGIPWEEVLPSWFMCASLSMEPDEWAETVVRNLKDFGGYRRDKTLRATRKLATPAQREALDERLSL